MPRLGIAVCSLNQLALDFKGNCERIIKSIQEAIQLNASIRVGPELDICGYGCEDAFYEMDTIFHSWQVLAEIISQPFKDILIDVGMPIMKDSALYNCRVLILNSKIILIRPKTRLAQNGNYRESRWFSAWGDGSTSTASMSWFQLPSIISELTKQTTVPFGDKAILEINSNPSNNDFPLACSSPIRIGFEICEEMWHANAQHVHLFGTRGCHVILNSSASYWEIRKLDRALTLIKSASSKSGGVYAFANLIGCDGGGRLCYYGRSLVMVNGELITMTTTKDTLFNEIQTGIALIDPNDVTQYRLQSNIKVEAHKSIGGNLVFDSTKGYAREIEANLNISDVTTINITGFNILKLSSTNCSPSNKVQHIPNQFPQLNLRPEEEIMMYCSLWLWDYLRRCPGLQGFIVPLSGGIDSCSVVCLVFSLCKLLAHQVNRNNEIIIRKLKSTLNVDEVESIDSPQKICAKLLKCAYLSTRFSGQDSERRARDLAQLVNAQFLVYNFDNIFNLIETDVPNGTKKIAPSSSSQSNNEVTLQQQNVQARLRMVLTYYLSEGKRLVLASGNVDEALVGYLTKYDCSSADLNPIGSISKRDLRNFMTFCKEIIPNSDNVLDSIIHAIPSAELTGENQTDEEDLQLTYDELSVLGRLRRGEFGTFGPFGVFCKIMEETNNPLIMESFKGVYDSAGNVNPEMIGVKVKRFFTLHARNRHKQTVLTPALHSETYSPDDNRFDHRQFLFDTQWTWQFAQIDKKIEQIKNENRI